MQIVETPSKVDARKMYDDDSAQAARVLVVKTPQITTQQRVSNYKSLGIKRE